MSVSIRHRCHFLWLLLVVLATFPAQAQAQAVTQDTVRGTVTDAETGRPVAGVVVQVVGTRHSTITDEAGRFAVPAASDGVLAFFHIAYQATRVSLAGRRTLSVALAIAATPLQELVVTGYATERRGDITGSVSGVNVEAATRETSSSILQKLDGHVAGVNVESGGAPGTRSTVRIRGIGSFHDNDPLYVVDGTPVEESYMNFLDPNDIQSIQVLKDASAATIYGSRASNGVVIIETKKGGGGAPKITLNAKFGVASPVKGYNSILIQNELDYFKVIKASYENAGVPISPTTTPDITAIFGDPNAPSIPKYVWAEGAAITGTDSWGRWQVDESKYSYPNTLIMPASNGTDWWGAVFRPAPTRDVNVGISGGSNNAVYYASFGYFDQNGTAIGSRFTRGTVRLNTEFGRGKFRVGENVNLSLELSHGQLASDGLGEDNIIGKNIFQRAIVPIKDIAGNWASGKANGLGNLTNPRKLAENSEHNINTNTRMFGNVYASFDLVPNLTLRSTLGFNLGQGAYRSYDQTDFENSEEDTGDAFFEGHSYGLGYTENTTLNYNRTFLDKHTATFLLGQEASKSTGRRDDDAISNLVSSDLPGRYIQDALGDPSTKVVNTYGFTSTLLSYFGKLNYNYNQRYFLSFTLRRDGSSNFGPTHRWGMFPAFSAGWRLSQEPFLNQSSLFSNLMLRVGYGTTGNQAIPTGRTVSQFGGSTGTTFYNINGDGNTIVTGYTQTQIGNPGLKWERDKSTNVGVDASLFGGNTNVSVDLYRKDTDDLLFAPAVPATQGQAAPPIVNIGAVRNTGIDLSLGYNGRFSRNGSWNVAVVGSHYKNEIRSIAGTLESFFGPIGVRQNAHVTINKLGHSIGEFYGYQVEGMFQTQAEIDALNANAPSGEYEKGAKPGRLRFKDVNGDGEITGDDATTIGSALPNWTGGLTFNVAWNQWSLGGTFYGTFGNKIYNAQRQFDVLRGFQVNVRKDLLANSWECAAPQANGSCPNGAKNPNAKYPRPDYTDNVSSAASSFYVEDGSYVRLRSLELGYLLPKRLMPSFEQVRVFVAAENLLTITGYDELDPAIPATARSNAVGDVRDQARGIDQGVYPTNRIISLGFNISF